jgi:hypothetical protein
MLAPGETGQAILSTETIAGVLSTGVPAGDIFSNVSRSDWASTFRPPRS